MRVTTLFALLCLSACPKTAGPTNELPPDRTPRDPAAESARTESIEHQAGTYDQATGGAPAQEASPIAHPRRAPEPTPAPATP